MNERNLYVFLSLSEFDSVCHNRIDDVRQKLYDIILQFREDSPNYHNLSKSVEDTILELSRIKLDMEEVARKTGGLK